MTNQNSPQNNARKRQMLALALAAAPVLAAWCGVLNDPAAEGYLARAQAMAAIANYEGCQDQLTWLNTLPATPDMAEDAARLKALSALYTADDVALPLIEEWIAKYPASPYMDNMLMARGDYWFAAESYSKALAAYKEVNPDGLIGVDEADFTYRQAFCRMLLGEFARATEMFGTLLNDPHYGAAASFYTGYIAYREGDYAKALQMFPAAKSEPTLALASDYYSAQCLYMLGQWEKAATLARATVSEGAIPQFLPEANRIAGEALYHLGRDNEAISYLRYYAEQGGDEATQPSAFYILGNLAYQRGEYDLAIKYLQRVVGLDDAIGQGAYLTLGQCYVKRGNIKSALLAFDKAYRIDYDPAITEAALYNYAVAQTDGGHVPFGNSVTLFEDFLRRFPTSRLSHDVQDYIVTGYLTDNDYTNALRSINSMRDPSPKVLAAKQRVLYVLGTREYESGNLPASLNYFNEARNTPGDNAMARECLLWQGTCHYDMEQYPEAIRALESYIKNSPRNSEGLPLAYYDLGYTYFAQGRYANACDNFRRVLSSSADNVMKADAAARAADCLYYQSKWSDAATYYQQALSLNPDAGDYAMFQLAMMKGMARDYRGKIEQIDRMIATYPSSSLVAAAMLEKAESYSILGDNNAAVATYKATVAKYPATASGRNASLQLAITYLNMGYRSEAINTYQSIIRQYPTSEEARVAADDLKRVYAADGRLADYASFIASVPNAPQPEASELERLAFESAEREFMDTDATSLLKSYLADYPTGSNRPQALYYMAVAESNKGDNRAAITYADMIIEGFPHSESVEDALAIKGDAQLELGMGERALETFTLLEERASGAVNMLKARQGVMRTADAAGRYDRVLDATSKLLASTASTGVDLNELHYLHAKALLKTGNTDGAIAEWGTLASNPVNIYGAMAAVGRAEALLAAGKSAEAEKSAETFIDANPPHRYWLARGFIVLSDALRAQGNDFEADEYLKSLRNNYPGSETDIFNMIDLRLKK